MLISEFIFTEKRTFSKLINTVTESQSYYFNRLSNIDRKKWIVEEQYLRNEFGITTMSDDVL